MNEITIAVCMATYKRHDGLRRALDALVLQNIAQPFGVIVANNDPADRDLATLLASYNEKLTLKTIAVQEPGVSAVRNEAIALARQSFPALKWIAVQDDDGIASPAWLDQLVQAGERHSADLVGGYADIEAPANRWGHIFDGTRAYYPDGPIKILNGTGNLLVAASYLEKIGRAAFRIDYGRSGGEDYEFFRLAQKNNAKMIWSNAAKITETWPAERMEFAAILSRNYRKGIYMARADVEYDGQIIAAGKTLRAFFAPFARFGKNILSRKKAGASIAACLNELGWACGRLRGHGGTVAAFYGAENA